ncbi:MAG TPA: FAD-dependent oxidoreductase [Candidatus Pacearchaeota archaeon]|jgi:thioredoxin reductase (NADPH)|nr:FAD-dependent oxidoreductase [Candidatus Parcubacteria bacterium]HNZ83894.1 FAD-dependent oxidoreductase [Candidatus Pacearchaeota archaeon]HPM08390.1 FAD-dependent oxidoreductase [Candidatus Pacearchaeota archaeon]
MEEKIHDLLIIGAGPAGMTASIYASRYGIDHLIIGNAVGGMASEATIIENWPGENKISGFELSKKIQESVRNSGGEIVIDTVNGIEKNGDFYKITTDLNDIFLARNILFASGTVRRKLGIPGEKEFLGKGVCYCVTCDGPLYKGKTVAVVGGGNAAVSAAIYLANICPKIYLIVMAPELQCSNDLKKQIESISQIEIFYNNSIKELKGGNNLESIVLKDGKNLDVKGIFIEIGGVPAKDLAEKLGVALDKNGHIDIKKDQSTNIPGIWAAGDISNGSNGLRQIVTSAAEGAIAANSIYSYLKKIDLE